MYKNLYLVRLLCCAVGGAIAGTISGLGVNLLAGCIGEPLQSSGTTTTFIWITLLGVGIALGISLGESFVKKGLTKGMIVIIGTSVAASVGFIWGSLIGGNGQGGAIFGGVLGLGVVGSITLFERFARNEPRATKTLMMAIFGAVGGAISGTIYGVLWYFLSGSTAQADGFAMLAIILSVTVGFICGTRISVGSGFADGYSHWNASKMGLLLVLLLIPVGLGIYEEDGGHKAGALENRTTKSMEGPYRYRDIPSGYIYTRKELADVIEKLADPSPVRAAVLYLLTRDQRYARRFKTEILQEAREGKYSGAAHSIKAQQFFAALRASSYLKLKDVPGLFSPDEKAEIVDWFKAIVERIFTVEWVDYLYALSFGRRPYGPYENQEIGVGALSVCARVIEKKYPELARRCWKFVDDHAVVWGGNFRNTDDSIAYQGLWIYNAYWVAKYRPKLKWLINGNARRSFEWILAQWPPNGMTPGYNEPVPELVPGAMALGAYIFHDGRYKWLANRMLNEMERRGIKFSMPYYYGLQFWDDSLRAIKPSLGSCYLLGPGNLPHDPGPPHPDKIVFRDGWEEDSFYALLNLRFSGWHRYKATGCFVNVTYGEPFVVEDIIFKRFNWLPAGRSLYVDRKIDRSRLNGFQLAVEGFEDLINDILQLGTCWAQDPPRYAEVVFFEDAPGIDVAKIRLPKWRGWTHERTSMLVEDGYFVVFDRARGEAKGKGAISWHLKGDAVIGPEYISLTQGKYSINVHFPHADTWYRTEISNSRESDPPAGFVHEPDLDLLMVSNDKSEAGFITLFYPVRDDRKYSVAYIDVWDRHKNKPAYPNALGVKIEKGDTKDIIGAKFRPGIYSYDLLSTDAEVFRLRQTPSGQDIFYKNARILEVDISEKPTVVTLDDVLLKEGTDWTISSGKLLINLPKDMGVVRISYKKGYTCEASLL